MTGKRDVTGQVVYRDLPASAYPFTAEPLDTATGMVVWSAEVTGPGALRVPAVAELGVDRVRARITYADGQITEAE